MEWIVFTQDSYEEVLVPKVMVFGDGTFVRWLGLDELKRMEPSDGPIKEEMSQSFLSFSEVCGLRDKMAAYKPGREPSP